MTTSKRAGMIGTVTVHLAVIGGAFWSARQVTRPIQQVYAVELVAASPAEDAPAKSTPVAVPPAPTRDVAPILPPKKTPTVTPPKKPVEAPPQKNPPVTAPVIQPRANEPPRNGSDVATISIPGFEGRYPEYIRNIYNQILSRFDTAKVWLGSPVAEIRFRIRKDGSADNLAYVVQSRNATFNREAMSAIEGAGNDKAFGKLPDDLSELEISFNFKPRQRP